MNAPEPTYEFKILREKPEDTDLFDGKTHEKVAEHLYQLINSEDEGVTIGLEGPWGSGKSTVLNLLKNKLDDNALFYVFDSWAHEGDPLRRAFLEGLINQATVPTKDDEEDILRKIKNELSGKTKKIDISTRFKPTKSGISLGLSALLVPIGAAILSNIDYGQIVMPWTTPNGGVHNPLITGLLLSLSPALVVAYNFICSIIKKKEFSISLNQNSISEDYTQNITQDPDKTSIEFEEIFEKIAEGIVTAKRFKKLIIVIDNLDRANQETITSTWATLQTFFQQSNANENTKNFWFIIPYDSTKIEPLEESPLDKIIQLSVFVPPPIFSSWAQYLETMINKSLIGWPKTEKPKIVDVFKRYQSNPQEMPTPRYIRRYINQVGALGKLWQSNFSSESLALYALSKFKMTNLEIQNNLISGNIPKAYNPILDKDIILKELAGLTFGVHPEKGMELLLKQHLTKAIKSGDEALIHKLDEYFSGAMESVIHLTLSDSIPSSATTEEYSINFMSAVTNLLCKYREIFTPEIDQILEYWRSPHTTWDFINHDYVGVLINLKKINPEWSGFSILKENLFMNNFLSCLPNSTSGAFKLRELINLNNFYIKISSISKEINPMSIENLTYENWIKWISICDENKFSFNFVQPNPEVMSNLRGHLKNNTRLKETCKLLTQCLLYFPDNKEWQNIKNTILENINLSGLVTAREDIFLLALHMSDHLESEFKKELSNKVIQPASQMPPITLIDLLQIPSFILLYLKLFEDEKHDNKISMTLKTILENKNSEKNILKICNFFKEHHSEHLISKFAEQTKNEYLTSLLKTDRSQSTIN